MDINKRHNLTNPYQTEAKKVLCVCSAGLLRSPTMANVLHSKFGFNTRSAGLSRTYALVPVTEELLVWSNEVLVAEDYMLPHIIDMFSNFQIENKSLYSLSIPDMFAWNDKKLREMIIARYEDKVLG